MILFLCFLWKKVGGNDLENLNQIENKTYEILNYDLYIDDNLYQKYEDNLSLFMSKYHYLK